MQLILKNLIIFLILKALIQISKKFKNKIPDKKIVPINTIFTVKCDEIHRAHIVCKGDDRHKETISEIETFVLDIKSLEILLMISKNNRLKIRMFDINHVYLFVNLKDEIHIAGPKEKGFVTPFKKALYVSRQSPRDCN